MGYFVPIGAPCLQPRRKPLNPQPLISHLTNSNRCGNLSPKVLLTVSPSRPSFPPQPNVYSRTSPGSEPTRLPSRTNLVSPLPEPDRNSRPFNRLRPLELSCLSFGHSYRLFSITCSLFLQNTRGWGAQTHDALMIYIYAVHLATPLPLPCALHRHRVRGPRFTRHSLLATFFYLSLESTLVNVQQNKRLYPSLESTLTQNRGRGSLLVPLILIHIFNLSNGPVGSISRSARFLPHAPARYMLGASPTMRFP